MNVCLLFNHLFLLFPSPRHIALGGGKLSLSLNFSVPIHQQYYLSRMCHFWKNGQVYNCIYWWTFKLVLKECHRLRISIKLWIHNFSSYSALWRTARVVNCIITDTFALCMTWNFKAFRYVVDTWTFFSIIRSSRRRLTPLGDVRKLDGVMALLTISTPTD